MSKFFIKRPIVAMVIAILMVIVGAVTIAAAIHVASTLLARRVAKVGMGGSYQCESAFA